MSASVHDTHHTDDGWKDSVIHGIGKPAQKNPAECWSHHRVGVGGLPDPFKCLLHRIKKAACDIEGAGNIPRGGLGKLRFRDRAEANREH